MSHTEAIVTAIVFFVTICFLGQAIEDRLKEIIRLLKER